MGLLTAPTVKNVEFHKSKLAYGRHFDKKLRYCRVTTRCVLSVVILAVATQQCRNYLYDKS